MRKNLFLICALLAAGCARDSLTAKPVVEVYQCGDYSVYVDPYIEKTNDLSGGLLVQEGAQPVRLNSSDIVKWPVVICGDGETEIWSKTLKTADSKIVFQLTRYENAAGAIDSKAVFSDTGLFRNGAPHAECEFLRSE
jgi:hypothetical protein